MYMVIQAWQYEILCRIWHEDNIKLLFPGIDVLVQEPIQMNEQKEQEVAEREHMWSCLIDSYSYKSTRAKKRAKKVYANRHACKPHEIVDCEFDFGYCSYTPVIKKDSEIKGISYDYCILDDYIEKDSEMFTANYAAQEAVNYMKFADCPPPMTTCANTPASVPQKSVRGSLTKKENNMAYNTTAVIAAPVDTTERDQRRYLHDRMYDIDSKKLYELRKTFNMDAPEFKTVDDVKSAMANGTIKLNPYYEGKDGKLRDCWFSTGMLIVENPKKDEAGFTAAHSKMTAARTALEDKITILSPKEGLEALNAFESATFH